MAETYNYTIDLAEPDIVLKINSFVMLEAKVKGFFFSYGYELHERLTNTKYQIKIYRLTPTYWGEERIEVHDDQKHLIMKFIYGRKLASPRKIWVADSINNISLINTGKKKMLYETGAGFSIPGHCERYRFIPSEITYKFVSETLLADPIFLLISCFCHYVVLRPRSM